LKGGAAVAEKPKFRVVQNGGGGRNATIYEIAMPDGTVWRYNGIWVRMRGQTFARMQRIRQERFERQKSRFNRGKFRGPMSDAKETG